MADDGISECFDTNLTEKKCNLILKNGKEFFHCPLMIKNFTMGEDVEVQTRHLRENTEQFSFKSHTPAAINTVYCM